MNAKILVLTIMTLLSSVTLAAESKKDLELKNGLYLRNFAKYTCNSLADEAILEPSYDLKALQAKVGDLLVDRQLNNALLKVTFTANATECRYSLLSTRDRASVALLFNKSKVYSPKGKVSDCAAGKITLDNAFKKVGYEATAGRHEFIALLLKTAETEKTCLTSNGVMRLVFDKNRNRNK